MIKCHWIDTLIQFNSNRFKSIRIDSNRFKSIQINSNWFRVRWIDFKFLFSSNNEKILIIPNDPRNFLSHSLKLEGNTNFLVVGIKRFTESSRKKRLTEFFYVVMTHIEFTLKHDWVINKYYINVHLKILQKIECSNNGAFWDKNSGTAGISIVTFYWL